MTRSDAFSVKFAIKSLCKRIISNTTSQANTRAHFQRNLNTRANFVPNLFPFCTSSSVISEYTERPGAPSPASSVPFAPTGSPARQFSASTWSTARRARRRRAPLSTCWCRRSTTKGLTTRWRLLILSDSIISFRHKNGRRPRRGDEAGHLQPVCPVSSAAACT